MANEAPIVMSETPQEKRARLFQQMFAGAIEQVETLPVAGEQLAAIIKDDKAIEKRDELVDCIGDVEVLIEALKKKEKLIAESRKQLEKSIYFLRENIRIQMVDLGFKRIDGFVHKMWLRDGTKAADSIEVTDLEAIPPEYLEWKPTPNETEILKALAEGKEIPGVKLVKGTVGEKILTIR